MKNFICILGFIITQGAAAWAQETSMQPNSGKIQPTHPSMAQSQLNSIFSGMRAPSIKHQPNTRCQIQTENNLDLTSTDSLKQGTVTFPDGRQITVMGHTHGVTSNVVRLIRIAGDTESPNHHYTQTTQYLLSILEHTLEQYRSEMSTLKTMISDHQIQFIAVEYGQELMDIMNRYSKLFLPMSRENFKKRGLTENSTIEDSLLGYAGPAHFMAVTNPELMKGIVLAGVEDDQLMDFSLDAATSGEKLLGEIIRKPEVNQTLQEYLEKTFREIVLNYDKHTYSESYKILLTLKDHVPPSLLKKVKIAMAEGLKAAELMRQRDALSTSKLLRQKGSGVLLIGSTHTRSILNLLRQECLK